MNCCSEEQPWEELGAPLTPGMQICEQHGLRMDLPSALHRLQLHTHGTGSLCIDLCTGGEGPGRDWSLLQSWRDQIWLQSSLVREHSSAGHCLVSLALRPAENTD